MKYLLSGARVHTAEGTLHSDVLVDNGLIISISPMIPHSSDAVVIDLNGFDIFPGFVDVHVHLREPGFSYKETIATGTKSAARGGYTSVCTMPNLNPPPDCLEHLAIQQTLIDETACVKVYPYGTITVGEQGEALSDMEALAPKVIAFSDDGRGVQNDTMMKNGMKKAASLGKIIAAHCENEDLIFAGYINEGEYAHQHDHRGICSESEWGQIARDVVLADKAGCAYHVCHVSTKESVQVIRLAKARGVDVTCETAPHYLVFTDEDLQEDGRFKMNPPLRAREDQDALIAGLLDGTIDMIATDHAPHSAEEKAKGLKESAMGIVGLETAFPVLYTKLVQTGVCSLEQLLEWMNAKPGRRFGIGSTLAEGQPADLTVFDLNRSYTIDPAEFETKGRATPFQGMEVQGRCRLTMVDGTIVWEE